MLDSRDEWEPKPATPSRRPLGECLVREGDHWRATRKLTIDYGVRYDFQTYPREQYGRLGTLGPTTANPSAGAVSSLSMDRWMLRLFLALVLLRCEVMQDSDDAEVRSRVLQPSRF